MNQILEIVKDVPEVPVGNIYWMIDHACRVDKLSLKVVSILLGILAVSASVARLFFRYRSAQTLNLEDYFILFATTCLVAEMGLILSFTETMYRTDGATLNLSVLRYFTSDPELSKNLFNSGPSILIAYLTLGWLAIFSVKCSFLALFHKMCRNVSRKLTAYFWVTVAATGTSCIVVILESFILCPRFGADATQCFLENQYTFSISSGVVVQSLDIVTDLMIISIPLTLLKMSHLKLQNKVPIAIVLCLSSICVILSIARLAAGMHRNVFGKWQFGMAWLSFMLHCEASVAVMAGSLPALRAFYTSRRSRRIETTPSEKLNEKLSDSLKGKALRLLEAIRNKEQPVLPRHERIQPRASIAKWPQSIIGIIPRRPMTYKGGDLHVVGPDGQRYSAAESVMIDPTSAYHNIRKQELQRDGIMVKRETMVWSDSARSKYASVDMSEAISHTGTIISSAGSSPELKGSDLAFPARAMSARKVNYFIDSQFGQITAGMRS
ncbi:hypothetical protein DPSP01_009962 [Paraphaeosphaeria sporulosa]|uniref:Rhodopsin domain-containing protein n=1 Tax=Paraphaeosphaeria sporulosa TaxID=1460663 RepID=A0A177CG65_9PLEO|nr:uncharacterized protein CC84DRAFT_1259264 [Paraphaeosphaeria sporulosa]OAG05942.1 hypothetical protein CC84DRAFT_1259264 [Paraphaeosphaeria sporulosa]